MKTRKCIAMLASLGGVLVGTGACDQGIGDPEELRGDVVDVESEAAMNEELVALEGDAEESAAAEASIEDDLSGVYEWIDDEAVFVGEVGEFDPVGDIAAAPDAQEGCNHYYGKGTDYYCGWKPFTSYKKWLCSRKFGGDYTCYRVGSTFRSGSCSGTARYGWGCYKNVCC